MAKPKFTKSVLTALRGIAHGFSKERNIKIQALLGLIVIIISLLLRIPRNEIILILFVAFLVIITELINTSIEKLIDIIHPKHHKEIGKIKDILAGAVLLSVILSIIVGLLILLKPVIEVLKIIF
ncbi:hypothetical protein AYK26_07050 [Euryarchaeota archaeon SM23-78]|nr:MAG: hypothetical protein AYK26_07050 [Euryarchaeota archaeon SM23-78]MBW3000785.1 diacylglycerol kinase family protein [Candidatus Woesearchaeota archaeon]